MATENRAVLDELIAAHTIIRNALNIMKMEQKLRWGAANERAGAVDGDLITGHHKRQAVIDAAQKVQTSTDLGISLVLLWQPVPATLPPDPHGGWFSPPVWLALSDGRVLAGQCLHKSADAKHDAPVHDWFAINPEKGDSQSLSCFGDDLSVIGWMPLAVPDHPNTANGRYLVPNTPLQQLKAKA